MTITNYQSASPEPLPGLHEPPEVDSATASASVVASRSLTSIASGYLSDGANLAQRSITYMCGNLWERRVSNPSVEESLELASASSAQLSDTPCISEDAYQNIKVAAHFANIAYKGFRDVRVLEFDGKEWETAFLGRATGINISAIPVMMAQTISGELKTTYISVPGTTSANDWLSNVLTFTERLGPSFNRDADDPRSIIVNDLFAHAGFMQVARSVIEDLMRLPDHLNFASSKEIICTGHSQGGAVTSILALYLATHKRKLNIPDDCSIRCVTFASPRVFTSETAKFYNQMVPESYNIINTTDVVPRFPLGSFGFKHIGTKIFINPKDFASTVYENVEDDLSQSLHAGDLDAWTRIFSVVKAALSLPSLVTSVAITCHSMDYYENIISSERGHEIISSTAISSEENLPENIDINTTPTSSASLTSITYHRSASDEDEENDTIDGLDTLKI